MTRWTSHRSHLTETMEHSIFQWNLLIDNSYLFNEVQLNTPLQAVAARVTLSKAVTVCNIYIPPLVVCNIHIPPSVDVSLSDLEQLIQELLVPFFPHWRF